MVPGIENSTGSYMMTISDMSVVTSEVMVDETDIINVRTGRTPTLRWTRCRGKPLPARSRSRYAGCSAQLGSGVHAVHNRLQEAKDFKVVVTLDHPPTGLRNGLSSTAKIVTAEKEMFWRFRFRLWRCVRASSLRTRRKRPCQAGRLNVTLAGGKPVDASQRREEGRYSGVFS